MSSTLIKKAFSNLHVPAAPKSALADLPDGRYTIPTTSLDKKAAFTIEKKGNGAVLLRKDTFYPLDVSGHVHIDEKSASTRNVIDATFKPTAQGVAVDATEQVDWLNMTSYGGGQAENTNQHHWRGEVGFDGTVITPEPVSLAVKVAGELKTFTKAAEARREDGTSQNDSSRHIAGEVQLITDSEDALWLSIPSSLNPSNVDLRVPVKDGGVLATGMSAGYSWSVKGTVQDGAMSLALSFDGSSMRSNVELAGSF